MPIAHNLNKVTKNLSKSTGQMHIKGRKFKQLNRATLRDQKITAKKLQRQEQKSNDLLIIPHVQGRILEQDVLDKEVFTLQDMKDFIEEFIGRFDEELKELNAQRRPGRPATSRHQILQEKKKYDEHVYYTGFKIPNISHKETVDRVRLWNGTHGGVTVMKFIHISRDMKELPTTEAEMKD